MRILVLGSAGQIGSHLVETIESATPHAAIRHDIVDGAQYDLRHRQDTYAEHLAQGDVVVFLAFDVGGSTYLETHQESFDFINNNMRMMANVFDLVGKARKPVLFASSQMATMDWSPYGMLKRAGELYTEAVGGIVVKFWNVYGREHDPEKFHVITDFIKMALKDGQVRMRTDGTEERQFLHADDCARALVHLVENHATVDRKAPLHITNFAWTSIRAIGDLVAHHVPGTSVELGPGSDTVQGVKNEPDPYMLQFWKPVIDLEAGIAGLVEHFSMADAATR